MALGDEQDGPAVGEQGPYVAQRAGRVPAVGLGGAELRDERVPVAAVSSSTPKGVIVHQGTPTVEGVLAYLGQGPERRRAEVERRLGTDGGRRPGRREELLAGGDEVMCSGADPLGVADQDVCARG